MQNTRRTRRTLLVTTLALCAVPIASGVHAQRPAPCAVSAAASSSNPNRAADLREGPHEVVLNGVRLWYCVAGGGPAASVPVLFLHGGPGYNSHSFATLAGPRLERGLRMIYLDQRGSGRSERPWNGHYQLDTLVADIEALRAALGVPRIAVVGHSFGGTLALEYAAAHPDRVSHLVLVSAAADLPAACAARAAWIAEHHPAALARMRQAAAPGTPEPDDCAIAFGTLDGEDFAAYNNAVMFPDPAVQARQDSVDAASGLRNTGELSGSLFEHGLLTYRFAHPEQLRMPVLVLAGRHDSAIGLEPQRALARSLPHARFVEYESGGHFLYLDEPEHFTSDVTSFIAMPD